MNNDSKEEVKKLLDENPDAIPYVFLAIGISLLVLGVLKDIKKELKKGEKLNV